MHTPYRTLTTLIDHSRKILLKPPDIFGDLALLPLMLAAGDTDNATGSSSTPKARTRSRAAVDANLSNADSPSALSPIAEKQDASGAQQQQQNEQPEETKMPKPAAMSTSEELLEAQGESLAVTQPPSVKVVTTMPVTLLHMRLQDFVDHILTHQDDACLRIMRRRALWTMEQLHERATKQAELDAVHRWYGGEALVVEQGGEGGGVASAASLATRRDASHVSLAEEAAAARAMVTDGGGSSSMLSVQSSLSQRAGLDGAHTAAAHPQSASTRGSMQGLHAHHSSRLNTALVKRILPTPGRDEGAMPSYLRVSRDMMQTRRPHPPRPLNVDENLNKLAAPVRAKMAVHGGEDAYESATSGGSGSTGGGRGKGRGTCRDVKMSTKLAALNDANGGGAKAMVQVGERPPLARTMHISHAQYLHQCFVFAVAVALTLSCTLPLSLSRALSRALTAHYEDGRCQWIRRWRAGTRPRLRVQRAWGRGRKSSRAPTAAVGDEADSG
jgi:hypothetical protein